MNFHREGGLRNVSQCWPILLYRGNARFGNNRRLTLYINACRNDSSSAFKRIYARAMVLSTEKALGKQNNEK